MSSSLRHRSYGPPRDEPRPCQAQSHCGQSRTLPSPCRHERHGTNQGSGNSLLWVTSPEMTSESQVSESQVSESQVSESKSPKASQSTDLPAALSIICANRNLRRIHVTGAKLVAVPLGLVPAVPIIGHRAILSFAPVMNSYASDMSELCT